MEDSDSQLSSLPQSPEQSSLTPVSPTSGTSRKKELITAFFGLPVGATVANSRQSAGTFQPVFMGVELTALVIGPPRCGKTTTMVIPAVLAAPAALVVTSTKDDVLKTTLGWRSQNGYCYVFDPTGTVDIPHGAYELRWSPVLGCDDFDRAVSMSHYLAAAARPGIANSPEALHWMERAETLLSPLLHAAAISETGISAVCRWVWGHDVREAEAILSAAGATMPKTILSSIWRTEERERSGIFSTASGILSTYRSPKALESASKPNFDPDLFVASYDTVYVCSPSDAQHQAAPLIVALLEQIRSAIYRRRRLCSYAAPVVFVLDEVAGIAPLPSLPGLAAEGAGQGLLTMACLQDLSQARSRWGAQADGFFSIFSLKVIFPGIGDIRTLELLSALGGDIPVPVTTVTRPTFLAALAGKGGGATTSHSWTWRRMLPIDELARGIPGHALLIHPDGIDKVQAPPWWEYSEYHRQVFGS